MVASALCGCVTGGSANKTALELQSFQRQEFETTKKIAFASTLSVFQDMGYIIKTADIETGLISASSPTQNMVFFGSTMKNTEASAFIEEMSPNKTFVRLNFVAVVEQSSGYGMKGKSDKPIMDAKTYQNCFQKIQEGIFLRTNSQ